MSYETRDRMRHAAEYMRDARVRMSLAAELARINGDAALSRRLVAIGTEIDEAYMAVKATLNEGVRR